MVRAYLSASSSAVHTRTRTHLLLVGMAIAIWFACAATAPAQTFTTIASLSGATGGSNPVMVFLAQGLDGNLYGTASTGGSHSDGTIFKVTTSGTVSTIYNFCSQASCADGSDPYGGLVLAPSGIFYGATFEGGTSGNGTAYKVTTTGSLTTLHTFDGSDGYNESVGLVLASNGDFYGTATGGGTSGAGNIYQITPTGGFKSIGSPAGSFPDGRLMQATNGLFYGIAYYNNLYEMTPAGKFTNLYNFSGGADGNLPHGPLVQDKSGNLWGGNTGGGGNGSGVIYKISPAGKNFTTVYPFCSLKNCADGGEPQQGVILGTDGNFYGITSVGGANGQGGTIFQLTPAGKYTVLYSFCKSANCADGSTSDGGLLQATDGNFYGVTNTGGAYGGGTVFRLSMGLKPFVHPVTTSGKVGATVVLLGTNLTGATAVDFSGTAGTIVKVTKTWLSATVPAGAISGPITATTPSAVLTSDASYRVTPQITSFTPTSGPVGTVVTITGVSLTKTTHVAIGGVTATYTVVSDTEITATVPTGAVTGAIDVTTTGGTAVSTTDFTVN